MLRAHAAAILSGSAWSQNLLCSSGLVWDWQVGFLSGGGAIMMDVGGFCVMSLGVLVQLFVCVLMLRECETGEWDK